MRGVRGILAIVAALLLADVAPAVADDAEVIAACLKSPDADNGSVARVHRPPCRRLPRQT